MNQLPSAGSAAPALFCRSDSFLLGWFNLSQERNVNGACQGFFVFGLNYSLKFVLSYSEFQGFLNNVGRYESYVIHSL